MNVNAFNAVISRAIRRGTSLDSVIPDWVTEAVLKLEQNYSFSWMMQTISATLLAGASTVTMPTGTKKIDWIKVVTTGDGGETTTRDLLGVEPSRVTGITRGYVQGFYLQGLSAIQFDGIPDEAMLLSIRAAVYTAWPGTGTTTPEWLVRAHNLLKMETLLSFATEMRDDRMIQFYAGRRDEALKTTLLAEEELKNSFQNDLVMRPDTY